VLYHGCGQDRMCVFVVLHVCTHVGPTIGKDPNSSFTYSLLFDAAEVNNSNAFGTLGYTRYAQLIVTISVSIPRKNGRSRY
jgi:hypothetical protein